MVEIADLDPVQAELYDRLRLGRDPGGLPGATVVQGSKRAAYRADQLGIAFHEVLVEANSQTIGLVFSEATVAELTPGYVPFIVASRGHSETYAEGSHLP